MLLGSILAPAAVGAEVAPGHGCQHDIGVLAHRPKDQVLVTWQPLGEALERALPGCRFRIEALTYPELEDAITARRLELVITNPGHFVEIRAREPMSGALATVIERTEGAPLATMAGVIFVRADRTDLKELRDLEHARVAAVGSSSLGGYQAQAFELLQAGVPAPGPGRLVLTGVPHDRTVRAVLEAQADAGFARAGTLEQMASEGRLDLSRLRILHPQPAPGFPYLASTRLYPEWPVVALGHLDPATARRVAAALLSMPHGVGAIGPGLHGFAIPADYGAVESAMRALRVKPFDGPPAFGAGDVLRRYQVPIASLLAALVVILGMAAGLVLVNRRLRSALASVRTLSGLLPICMYCHKIRTDQGYWDQLESFITARSEAAFSHGICPACLDHKFPGDGGVPTPPPR